MKNTIGRSWLAAAALALACAAAVPAHAAAFPSHPINIIVPSLPGGVEDYVARQVAQQLTQRTGASVIVTNHPGANGAIGSELVAKAEPDGYTIGIATPGTVSTDKLLQPSLPYDPAKDFTPITMAVRTPVVLVVSPRLPVKTLKDFIAYGKGRRESLSCGDGGVGSTQYLSAAIFRRLTGLKIVDVPYKGGAGPITDLISGRLDMFLTSPLTVVPFIRNGQLRALAVATPSRLAQLPNVPTFKEAGLDGFHYSAWYGFIAPKGVPPEVLQTLNRDIVAILTSDPVKSDLKKFDYQIVANSSADFGRQIADEVRLDTQILGPHPTAAQ